MKIKRRDLERMVKEELARHLQGLLEAGPKKPEIADADKDKAGEEAGRGDKKGTEPQKDPDNTAGKPKTEPRAVKPPAPDAPPVQPAPTDEPADQALDVDVDSDEDDVEDAEELTGGDVADEVTGKTIQSITMEPKSKMMPGAMELVLTFKEIPDPLRVLITKTGGVKFYFRGLHNEL